MVIRPRWPGWGAALEASLTDWAGDVATETLTAIVRRSLPRSASLPLITGANFHAPGLLDLTGLITDAGGIKSLELTSPGKRCRGQWSEESVARGLAACWTHAVRWRRAYRHCPRARRRRAHGARDRHGEGGFAAARPGGLDDTLSAGAVITPGLDAARPHAHVGTCLDGEPRWQRPGALSRRMDSSADLHTAHCQRGPATLTARRPSCLLKANKCGRASPARTSTGSRAGRAAAPSTRTVLPRPITPSLSRARSPIAGGWTADALGSA